jgi:hypothetical protein
VLVVGWHLWEVWIHRIPCAGYHLAAAARWCEAGRAEDSHPALTGLPSHPRGAETRRRP